MVSNIGEDDGDDLSALYFIRKSYVSLLFLLNIHTHSFTIANPQSKKQPLSISHDFGAYGGECHFVLSDPPQCLEMRFLFGLRPTLLSPAGHIDNP